MRRQKKQVFGFSISKKYLLSFLSLSKKKKLVEMISRIFFYISQWFSMSFEGLHEIGHIETMGKKEMVGAWVGVWEGWREIVISVFLY